jgi:hypothetical protein
MSESPNLKSLLESLYQAGLQAEYIRATLPAGRTRELMENVAHEIQLCAEGVDDEIKVLRRHGEGVV